MKTELVFMLAILAASAFVTSAYATGSSDWDIDNDYAHIHATAGHSPEKICGDHICKPGEKYNP